MFERCYWTGKISQTSLVRFIVWESEEYSVEPPLSFRPWSTLIDWQHTVQLVIFAICLTLARTNWSLEPAALGKKPSEFIWTRLGVQSEGAVSSLGSGVGAWTTRGGTWGTFVSLLCDELKWPIQTHLSPAEHQPRQEAALCAADSVWMSLGFRKPDAFCSSRCAFLLRGWFSLVSLAVCMFRLLI